MKRILMLIIVVALVLAVAACSNSNSGPDTGNGGDILKGSLEDILEKIYEGGDFSSDFKTYTIPGLITAEITEDTSEYHLGKSGIEFKEAIVSEHEMSPSAYALCLLRAKDDADIEKLKKDIKDNVNPNKWICVGVDPKNIIVDNIGDVVILIMSDSDAQSLLNAFRSLNK